MLGRTIGKSTGLLELYKKRRKINWDYLTSRGWTKQSVSALLGNMQSESGIIADRWESDRVGNMNGSIWMFNGEQLTRLDGVSAAKFAKNFKTTDVNKAEMSSFKNIGFRTVGEFKY